MAALSYMQRRRSGTYEFRRRLPQVLAGKPAPDHIRSAFPILINASTGLFKREFVRSLDTKELRPAKTRDHQEALTFARLLEEVMAALSHPAATPSAPVTVDANEIGESVFRQLLEDDETTRLIGDDRRRIEHRDFNFETCTEFVVARATKFPHLIDVPASSAIGMQLDHAEIYGEENIDLANEYRAAYARRDPSIVAAETSIELKRRGASYEKSSAEYQAVALEVLRAHVRAYDAIEKRHQGVDIPTPVEPVRSPRGPRLSEAFEVWKMGGGGVRGSKTPGKNSIIETGQVVRYFTDLYGDIHLGDITRAKAREFRDAIAKVPTRLPTRLRKMPLPKLLEQDLSGQPLRHANTVNKLLQLIGAVVSKAEAEAMLDDVEHFANPFTKAVKLRVDDGDTEDREIFSKADLRAIFTSPVFSGNWRTVGGKGEAPFWLPLIGLLSGMRLNEMAGMRLIDLREDEDDDVWFFDVSRKGGRSTKTATSIRRIPLHPELKRIGLLTYRAWLLDRGAKLNDPLWPGVKSSAWSKWVNSYLNVKCGITDSTKVFHSFRHTFKRMARDAELYEELHDAITGHANKGSVGRDYGAGFSIKPLAKAMAQIKPPIDLKALTWKLP